MKRVVVDPNVLLSALVGNPEAAPAILLEAIHDHAVEMVACPTLIAEVRENLTEPYFRALLDQGEAEQAVTAIERVAVMLDDPSIPSRCCATAATTICLRSRDPRKPRRSSPATRIFSIMPACSRPRSGRARPPAGSPRHRTSEFGALPIALRDRYSRISMRCPEGDGPPSLTLECCRLECCRRSLAGETPPPHGCVGADMLRLNRAIVVFFGLASS